MKGDQLAVIGAKGIEERPSSPSIVQVRPKRACWSRVRFGPELVVLAPITLLTTALLSTSHQKLQVLQSAEFFGASIHVGS